MQIEENKANNQKGREGNQVPEFWGSTSYYCPDVEAMRN